LRVTTRTCLRFLVGTLSGTTWISPDPPELFKVQAFRPTSSRHSDYSLVKEHFLNRRWHFSAPPSFRFPRRVVSFASAGRRILLSLFAVSTPSLRFFYFVVIGHSHPFAAYFAGTGQRVDGTPAEAHATESSLFNSQKSVGRFSRQATDQSSWLPRFTSAADWRCEC
jgi:hypothetical protein